MRQTAGGVDLDIVAPDGCEPEPVAVSVRNALLAAGLSNPSVNVRVVPAIDRNPATGKARRFIPLPSTPPT